MDLAWRKRINKVHPSSWHMPLIVDTETPQHKLVLGRKTEVAKWLVETEELELSVANKLWEN